MPNLNGGLDSAKLGECMRKIAVFCVLLGMIGISETMAGDLKVLMPNITSCSRGTSYNNYTPYVEVTCQNNRGESIEFHLHAQCAQTTGTDGATANSLTLNATSYPMECWCRVVSPGVSKWVHITTYGDARCYDYCNLDCGGAPYSSSVIRNALFSNWVAF